MVKRFTKSKGPEASRYRAFSSCLAMLVSNHGYKLLERVLKYFLTPSASTGAMLHARG